jgi:hypothetical protein
MRIPDTPSEDRSVDKDKDKNQRSSNDGKSKGKTGSQNDAMA